MKKVRNLFPFPVFTANILRTTFLLHSNYLCKKAQIALKKWEYFSQTAPKNKTKKP